LRHKFAVVKDWSSDEMREKGYEKEMVEKAEKTRFTLLEVNQIPNLRKREEGNPQRKNDASKVVWRVC
jgi:hypothetical protein